MTNAQTQPKKPEGITVIYKGQEMLMQPGKKVFELNTDTGFVQEHKLKKKFRWFWQPKREVFLLTYAPNIQHLPAIDLKTAILEFKIQNSDLVKKRKKEGSPLYIHG